MLDLPTAAGSDDLPTPVPVKFVILVDDEVPVGDGEGPIHAIRSQDAQPRQPIGCLTKLHHERVTSLLQQLVSEIA